MTTLTIEDGESSFLKGKAEFEKWQSEFDLAWNMPRVLDFLGTILSMMPVESRLIAPYETTVMEQIYKKTRGG